MAHSRQGSGTILATLLKSTLVGGLLFLLPLVLLAVLLGHAMKFASTMTRPLSDALSVEAVVGAGGEKLVAILLLACIAIAAGLLGRTRVGKLITRWSEDSFLGGLPQYRLMKSMAEGLAHVEDADGVTPALINIEGAWQLGYVLEPLENGWVAVFLPQAPTPMSGNAMYMPAERVRPLDITMAQAMTIVRHLGLGSAKTLGGVDFTLPASGRS
jgi:uncharacterized membrane protein